ncbi:hypothetical protein ACRAWF_12295 [Streptomyces sp. L7]
MGILVTVFALTFAVCAPTAPILLRRWNRGASSSSASGCLHRSAPRSAPWRPTTAS